MIEHYCKGCGLCVVSCRKGALVMAQRANAQGVRPAEVREEVVCVLCGRCAAMCPEAAIILEDEEAEAAAKTSDGKGSEEVSGETLPGAS